MLKILKKIAIYSILLFIGMEILVRFFHLHNEKPVRYVDQRGVEKWVPNQAGFSITGNRKQNIGKYSINNFGFNSIHQDYETNIDSLEIALVGDSFIEGFHEDYRNSLGQQLQKEIKGATVLEFGYAGYDLADELHLMKQYKELFAHMDYVFIYVKYTDDLDRDSYDISSRLSLDSPVSRIIKEIKLLVYLKDIGLLDPITKLRERVNKFINNTESEVKTIQQEELLDKEKDLKRLENFQRLLNIYTIDKKKCTFLLDKRLCSPMFLNYLERNKYLVLDLNKVLVNSKKPTTLVYDQHWSKHGRKLVSELLVNYINGIEEEIYSH